MSIDFDNGFLLGLAIAYKESAVAIGLEGFLIVAGADGVLLSAHIINAHDFASATQPEDMRPPTADSVDITAITVSDAVQVILV